MCMPHCPICIYIYTLSSGDVCTTVSLKCCLDIGSICWYAGCSHIAPGMGGKLMEGPGIPWENSGLQSIHLKSEPVSYVSSEWNHVIMPVPVSWRAMLDSGRGSVVFSIEKHHLYREDLEDPKFLAKSFYWGTWWMMPGPIKIKTRKGKKVLPKKEPRRNVQQITMFVGPTSRSRCARICSILDRMTIFQKPGMSSPLGCNFSKHPCHTISRVSEGGKNLKSDSHIPGRDSVREFPPVEPNPTRPWPPALITINQGPLRPCSKAFSASFVWCCLGHRLVLGAWAWNSSYRYQPWSTFCNFHFWYLLYGVCIWACLGPSLIKTIQVSEMSESFTIMSLCFTQIVDPYDILWNVLQPLKYQAIPHDLGERWNPFIYAPDLASSKLVRGPIMSVTQA